MTLPNKISTCPVPASLHRTRERAHALGDRPEHDQASRVDARILRGRHGDAAGAAQDRPPRPPRPYVNATAETWLK